MRGQQDRITDLLRKRATPSPSDYQRLALANLTDAGGFNQGLQQMQDRALQSEFDVLKVFEAQKASGDAQAKALDDKISLFTGDDPEGKAMFLQELHNDPEEIDPGNSYQVMTKLAGIAKKSGYESPSIAYENRKRELDLQKTESEIQRNIQSSQASGGATGELMNRLLKDNPDWTATDALYFIQTGARKGTKLDEQGNIISMGGSLDVIKDTKAAEQFGKRTGEFQADFPKVTASAEAALRKANYVQQDIDSILPRVSAATAGFASLLDATPGSPQANLLADLETILASTGFNEINEMRQNSPTGGALGSVSENELRFLQSAISNVRNSQSPEQLRTNLLKLKQRVGDAKQAIQRAYENDLKVFGKQPDINQSITKPRLKYNPATGEFE